ncbi:MAG: LapA family protein [Hydrococcus sp. Prado102]|jgi:hypothetical protein|nr:LapA family protein [Hydrococcus sp. Prado102]
MRFIILLLLLGIGIVFFLQNQQLVTLVFFGNVATVTLPIAVWVLSFTGIGILTSFCWQVLSSIGRPSASGRSSARQSRPYSSPPPSPPPQPRVTEIFSDNRPPQQDFARSPTSTRPSNVNPKDFEEEWDDWQDEQPKREPVRDFVREFPRDYDSRTAKSDRIEPEVEDEPIDNSERIPKDNANLFEVQQQPKTSNRTGSVYSYVYREPKDKPEKEPPVEDKKPETQESKGDRVYDADYRVIRPPYQPPPPEQPRRDIEDDEDWI